MKKLFGRMPSGHEVWSYTICGGGITAEIIDLGATIVKLLVPDSSGNLADVVLGYDTPDGYLNGTCYLGAVVGRNANRIGGAEFSINGNKYSLSKNENANNLHSGPDVYHARIWKVNKCTDCSIEFMLESPDGDQGFPGNAAITVLYTLDDHGGLHITYDAVSDQDTVFNLTNHSYFNLAGHDHTGSAMMQTLMLPSERFTPADAEAIPTGEERPVEGTPMDFRTEKPIGRDINQEYEPLILQGGYDHNYIVNANPCAVLRDPESGRTMSVSTDLPGIQFYAGNFLDAVGKNGAVYGKRSAVALETQYYPDSIHHAEWAQPITRAGEKYHTETVYRFTC